MRIGAIMQLVRQAEGLSLRAFADMLGDRPHSTLAGIEGGWIAPSDLYVLPFLEYIERSIYRGLVPIAEQRFNQEMSLRLTLFSHIELLTYAALTALKAFVIGNNENRSWLQPLFWTIIQDGKIRFYKKDEDRATGRNILGALLKEDKLKALAWILIDTQFVSTTTALQMNLTERPSKIQKLLKNMPITGGGIKQVHSYQQLLDLLDTSEALVPDTYHAIDILLLLTKTREITLTDPLKMSISVESINGLQTKSEIYVPYDYLSLQKKRVPIIEIYNIP